MFSNIGLGEIVIIAIVLMVLFGGQKFPELARGIAQAMKEVVFDRNGFKYTGRVKMVADAAREAGLKF